MNKMYKVKDSIFEPYTVVILDLDNTIWSCFDPRGNSIGAKHLEVPFVRIDETTFKDIRENIIHLDPTIKDVLEALDDYGIKLGICSRAALKDVTENAQPAVEILKKADLWKYFDYTITIKPDIKKSEYVFSDSGKVLFIDDQQDNLQDVEQSGRADVLDRRRFKEFGDLFTESKPTENTDTQLRTQQNPPLPVTSALITFSDPLTYTSGPKSDMDNGNTINNGEMFHQEDHYTLDNGRDHAWGEPWEPMGQMFLDPNIIPTVDDKLKQQDPNKGGIAVSNLRFATINPRVLWIVKDLLYEFSRDIPLDEPIEEMYADVIQFATVYEPTIVPYLEANKEDVIKFIGEHVEVEKQWQARVEERRKSQEEFTKKRREEALKNLISNIQAVLTSKFNNESFTIDTLAKSLSAMFHDVTVTDISNAIRELPEKDPQQFKLDGNILHIGGGNNNPNLKIDTEALKQVALAPIESFKQYGQTTETPNGIYIYIDRGSDILGVAHLDTVQDMTHFEVTEEHGDKKIRNAQLDDRLGAYVLLNLLPTLGVNCDILLTEGEETAQFTARYFKPSKQYKWMFSFDRAGMDTVMYQYDDEPTRKLVNDSGFLPAKGSFSDISVLEHLGVKGFNFGVGYYDNHGDKSHAIESHVLHNVKLFIDFYNKHKDTPLEHQQKYRYNEKPKSNNGFNTSMDYFSSLKFENIATKYSVLTDGGLDIDIRFLSEGTEKTIGAYLGNTNRQIGYTIFIENSKNKYGYIKIQQSAVSPQYRKLGIGKVIQEALISYLNGKYGLTNYSINSDIESPGGTKLHEYRKSLVFSPEKIKAKPIFDTDGLGDYDFKLRKKLIPYLKENGIDANINEYGDIEVLPGQEQKTNELLNNLHITGNLKFSGWIDLPEAEQYPDYYGNMDVAPKDPKHQDELEEPSGIRKDIERQWFETGLHNTVDRPETHRELTPFAGLKFGSILESIPQENEASVGILVSSVYELKRYLKPYQVWKDTNAALTSKNYLICSGKLSDDYNDDTDSEEMELRGAVWSSTLNVSEFDLHATTSAAIWGDVFPLKLIMNDYRTYRQASLSTLSFTQSPVNPDLHRPNSVLVHSAVDEAFEHAGDIREMFVPRRETQDDYKYRVKSAAMMTQPLTTQQAHEIGRSISVDEALEFLERWYSVASGLKGRTDLSIQEKFKEIQKAQLLREVAEARAGLDGMKSVGGKNNEERYNNLRSMLESLKQQNVVGV